MAANAATLRTALHIATSLLLDEDASPAPATGPRRPVLLIQGFGATSRVI
jgi:hypothetical protein